MFLRPSLGWLVTFFTPFKTQHPLMCALTLMSVSNGMEVDKVTDKVADEVANEVAD